MAGVTGADRPEAGGIVDLEERRLLPRHASGDADAFAELIAAYRAPVYGYLVRCGLGAGERDDLFQEIFLKVHGAAAAYQPSRPLKPWLFTIAANTVRSHFRRLGVRPVVASMSEPGVESVVVDPRPTAHAVAAGKDTVAWLEGAILDLPLAHREVLILTCVEGMDQNEVAAALQIPVNTVKTNLRRARLKLAEALAARDGGRS